MTNDKLQMANGTLIKFICHIVIMAVMLTAGERLMAAGEKIEIYNALTGKTEMVEPVMKTEQEWREILDPQRYSVLRGQGTEPAFSQVCPIPKGGKGIYQCAACGTHLFAYDKKFDSKTGWPSFWHPISELNVRYVEDSSFGMERVEVNCARCGGHLGHVFDDGPPPTGKRYCINTVALKLLEMKP